MSRYTIQGRVALVTGGGRGIGVAIARRLALEGVAIVVAARTGAEIDAVAAELLATGTKAAAFTCDVTDPAQVRELADHATAQFGAVDILINNAGVADSAPLHRVTLDDWNRLLAVNATGPFLVTQALLPGMLASGWGRIVNIASVAGLTGAKYTTAYTASKHALIGLTRATAAEVADRGVTVNAVCPGYVDTPMTDQSVARIVAKTKKDPEVVREALRSRSPQRRLIEPHEVAHVVVGLCDERAGGINGQAIVIDGGATRV